MSVVLPLPDQPANPKIFMSRDYPAYPPPLRSSETALISA